MEGIFNTFKLNFNQISRRLWRRENINKEEDDSSQSFEEEQISSSINYHIDSVTKRPVNHKWEKNNLKYSSKFPKITDSKRNELISVTVLKSIRWYHLLIFSIIGVIVEYYKHCEYLLEIEKYTPKDIGFPSLELVSSTFNISLMQTEILKDYININDKDCDWNFAAWGEVITFVGYEINNNNFNQTYIYHGEALEGSNTPNGYGLKIYSNFDFYLGYWMRGILLRGKTMYKHNKVICSFWDNKLNGNAIIFYGQEVGKLEWYFSDNLLDEDAVYYDFKNGQKYYRVYNKGNLTVELVNVN